MKTTLNAVDSALNSGSPDWNAISSLIDVDSFVRYYFVNELTENPEIVASSVYFYKNGPGDTLHAGPVWDFDSALFNYDKSESLGSDPQSDYTKNARILRDGGNGWFSDLFRNPAFVARVNELWASGIGSAAAKVPAQIDTYQAQLTASATKNFDRWTDILGHPTKLIRGQGKSYAATYADEVSDLRSKVSQRVGFLQREYGPVPTLRYRAQVQDTGWMPPVSSGQIAGTVGQSLRLETVALDRTGLNVPETIQARSHVQTIGWGGWGDAAQIGTAGQGLRLEAFQYRLTGDLAARYDISYRAEVQNIGWQPWVTNGAVAGTEGKSLRIEAVQIRLLARDADAPSMPTSNPVRTSSTTYAAQVQDVGWMPSVRNGALGGTTGRSLRLETLRLAVASSQFSGDIRWRAHVQDIGWQGWTTSANQIGTVGRGLRLEAFEIALTGDLAQHFSIRYRAHVQDIGWQPFVADGAMAGTTGRGRRVEAVQIELVSKV